MAEIEEGLRGARVPRVLLHEGFEGIGTSYKVEPSDKGLRAGKVVVQGHASYFLKTAAAANSTTSIIFPLLPPVERIIEVQAFIYPVESTPKRSVYLTYAETQRTTAYQCQIRFRSDTVKWEFANELGIWEEIPGGLKRLKEGQWNVVRMGIDRAERRLLWVQVNMERVAVGRYHSGMNIESLYTEASCRISLTTLEAAEAQIYIDDVLVSES